MAEPNRSKDPLEGTPYRTTSRLGRGAMGVVVEAEHVRLKKRVCVKLLHAELAERADLVDRMRIEAQSLAALEPPHPNLVMVTDFGETPAGQPYVVMERLYGRTLADERKARGGWLPVGEAIDIVCQALAGLAAAHARGIVHRDVKPGNLFVCDATDGGARTVKVLDFGIAKLATTSVGRSELAPLAYPTEVGMAIGTPRFFSPEQASGLPVDQRTDLYAMGLVLYTLVAGRGPFENARDFLELTTAHVEEAPPPPSQLARQALPPDFDRVVLKALSKRREDRFASAEEFAAALRRIPAPASTRWPTTELIVRAAQPPARSTLKLRDSAMGIVPAVSPVSANGASDEPPTREIARAASSGTLQDRPATRERVVLVAVAAVSMLFFLILGILLIRC